jgi:hypothetical protein
MQKHTMTGQKTSPQSSRGHSTPCRGLKLGQDNRDDLENLDNPTGKQLDLFSSNRAEVGSVGFENELDWLVSLNSSISVRFP